MDSNFLHRNKNTTGVILFGQKDFHASPEPILGWYFMSISLDSCKNCGVVIHSHLKRDKPVSQVVGSSFLFICLFAKVKSCFFKDFEKYVHAFITTHLDCCNSLYIMV